MLGESISTDSTSFLLRLPPHSVRPSVKIAAPPDSMHPLHKPRGIHPDKLPDLLALPHGSDKPNRNILQYCIQINKLSLLFPSC
ncbi:hypothetical protein AAC387_Pa09g0444 [Persea americana]